MLYAFTCMQRIVQSYTTSLHAPSRIAIMYAIPFGHLTTCDLLQHVSALLALCSVYEDIRSARVSKFRRAGFKTRAAVIVLPDSSLFRRQRKQHQEEGKSVPEAVIADMRGMLRSLPLQAT